MQKNGIELACSALDLELEWLWEVTSELNEIYLEYYIIEHGYSDQFHLKPKFTLIVEKKANSIQIYWRRIKFAKMRGKSVRMDQHIPLNGKDRYSPKAFKGAKNHELSVILRLEEEFAKIRRRSNKILRAKKLFQQYERHHMQGGPLAFDNNLETLYAAVIQDLKDYAN